MADYTLSTSNIFLTIVCAFLLVANFMFNFTFLVTLLKLRRLNRIDKSNYLLTHLILIDFISAFFVLVPSGYGVYNSNQLSFDGCKLQTFFTTFFLSSHFSGLLILALERYARYRWPIWHINFFTNRLQYDENDDLIGKKIAYKTLLIILGLWIYNIFVAFIPFFANYGDVQFFATQSQSDYIYEKFVWWLWLFFWVCLTIPFVASFVLFLLTLKMIFHSDRIVKTKRTNFDLDSSGRRKSGSIWVDKIIEGVDITRQPGNKIYYEHIINPDAGEETLANDFHVRNQLLAQYKYSSEKSKTISFFIISIISYVLVFPLFVIHFTRVYRNINGQNTNYDDVTVIGRGVYTAFVWISFSLLIVKSFVCLTQNKFYRYALYQSANCRGFNGIYDFQKEIKQIISHFDHVAPEVKKKPAPKPYVRSS